jgi:hypothetical protein
MELEWEDLPWFFDLYSQSTITSLSDTAPALKLFLTAIASVSFCTLRFAFDRAMVGDIFPMPWFSTT